jgi:hypothetical protein
MIEIIDLIIYITAFILIFVVQVLFIAIKLTDWLFNRGWEFNPHLLAFFIVMGCLIIDLLIMRYFLT